MHWFFEQLLNPLGLFGLAAQALFMFRFVIQWFASERRGRSYVPVAFWYISLSGGLLLFIYATVRKDPVIMLGQLLGIAIYVRNLVLIYRRRWRIRARFGANARPLLGETLADSEVDRSERELSARRAEASNPQAPVTSPPE